MKFYAKKVNGKNSVVLLNEETTQEYVYYTPSNGGLHTCQALAKAKNLSVSKGVNFKFEDYKLI